ncbi:MAG: hypothetical protein WC380_00020 [Pedobacter sp.]|jgi:hypothetical protein
MIETLEKHPVVTGLLSAGSSVGFSIIGILSQESTVRLLGSIGAILGIILTILSICIAAKKLFKDGK